MRLIEIGPAQAAKSYLNRDAMVRAAEAAGADAVHPGYGFLGRERRLRRRGRAGRADLRRPPPRHHPADGRQGAGARGGGGGGVPIVPGAAATTPSALAARARPIGYPVMIKAAAGGGGRGIRIAADADELRAADAAGAAPRRRPRSATMRSTSSASCRARVMSRCRCWATARASCICSSANARCSAAARRCGRRRRPPASHPASARDLCASAVRLAASVGYRGAGTLEYLLDATTGEFFFIEMNTRIQVEHPRDRDGHRRRSGARDADASPAASRCGWRRTTSRCAATRSSAASTPRTRPATSCPRPARAPR